jgi:rare lipoprotein A
MIVLVTAVEQCKAQADEHSTGSLADRFHFDTASPSAGETRSNRGPRGFLRNFGISPAEAAPAARPESPPTAVHSPAPPKTGTAATAKRGTVAPRKARTKWSPGRRIARGQASYYEHPGRTASGEVYKPDRLTAAHKTLPLGTRVRVVNLKNGKSVVVRINDRMPRHLKKVIDLSRGSARAVGIARQKGVAQVALYKLE